MSDSEASEREVIIARIEALTESRVTDRARRLPLAELRAILAEVETPPERAIWLPPGEYPARNG